jgi:C-terminal processing protease CtpA/Prc
MKSIHIPFKQVGEITAGSPAARHGLMRSGDVILEIDGVGVDSRETSNSDTLLLASRLLRGPVGSRVSIKARHTSKAASSSPALYHITLTRFPARVLSKTSGSVQSLYHSLAVSKVCTIVCMFMYV